MTDHAPPIPAAAPAPLVSVRCEQAVYGSFAFRPDGYALLARSPGCRDEWLADFRAACQQLGERPAGVADFPGLFALRLRSGPWLVVGVSPQGRDDRGRPGALGFHGLFLTGRDYRALGASPFALASELRTDWPPETEAEGLPALTPSVAPEPGPPAPRLPSPDPVAAQVAAAFGRGRRVAIERPEPGDNLARAVWRLLPPRARSRAALATWAFGNGNRFDLLITPRLAGIPLDSSYVIIDPDAPADAEAPRRTLPPRLVAGLGLAALLAGGALGLALRGAAPEQSSRLPLRAESGHAPDAAPDPTPPPSEDGEELGPEERRDLSEALVALAERFGVPAEGGGEGAEPDLTGLLRRVSADLRYEGPLLTESDRAALAALPGRDPALALRWDTLVRKFVPDRPLPGHFAANPLPAQVRCLAWSFHHDDLTHDAPGEPRRSPAEVAHALAEGLALDVPLRQTPLAGPYPALSAYVAFLARLPRR